MFGQAFPEAGLCEGLPRNGWDVSRKLHLERQGGRSERLWLQWLQRAVRAHVSGHPAPAPTREVSPALCEKHDFKSGPLLFVVSALLVW